MHILVLAPHPDDETIGCGGSLILHARKGDRISAIFLSSGELGLKKLPREKAWSIREGEAMKAAKILGIGRVEFLRGPDWMLSDSLDEVTRRLRPLVADDAPDLVYLPHPAEWHPDHKVSLSLLQAVLRDLPRKSTQLRGYEVWTPLERYEHVQDITSVMTRKLRALRAHASQLSEFDYARAIQGLNMFRGELAGKCRYAEVFQDLEF